MRPAALLFVALSIAVLCALAWTVGALTAERVERSSLAQADAALRAAGENWAGLTADGLSLKLTGEAPGAAEHLHAIETIGRLISPTRIEDKTSIAPPIPVDPPEFHFEFLRSGGDLSLIGLVPARPGAEPIITAANAVRGVENITNLLETAEGSAPPEWSAMLEFSLGAVGQIPQGSVAFEKGELSITALADSPVQQQKLETALRESAPQTISLTLKISAPPPVIAPFTFVLDMVPEPRLSACSASTPDGRDRILGAARRAGVTGNVECRIGLGTPSLLWPRAVDLGVAALEQMQGGTLQVRDTELTVTAPGGLDSKAFEALSDDLRRVLPAPFSLRAVLPDVIPGTTDVEKPAPLVFIAELSLDGGVHVSGQVQDATSDQAIMTYAASLFGFGKVAGTLSARDDVPEGWPGRVLTGLETLALLRAGQMEVTANGISVAGRGDSEHIALEVRDVLRLRLGSDDGIAVNVRYDPALVPPENPGLHPAQCEIRIATLLENGQITFAPNEVEIEPDSLPILDAIAEILKQCGQARFEIGGHTDSQGREVLNMGLSQSRADAVLDALLAREVLIAELTARGYGESQPITTNKTDEGRQKNRRIEFKLLGTIDEQD